MNGLETTQLVVTSASIGAFLPIIIGWVNWYVKSTVLKEIIALGLSTIVGYFVAKESGQLDPANLLLSIAAVATAAQVMYIKLFNPKWSGKK